jgi:hypothetical protein
VSNLSLKAFAAFLVTAVLSVGCGGLASAQAASPADSRSGPPVKRIPPTPIAKKKAELGGPTWKVRWTRIAEHAIPFSMLTQQVPNDVRHFCPRFYSMTDPAKRSFWAYFFQALSGAEASLDPRAKARHVEPKLARIEHVPADQVMTEGLLQLTYADSQRYGCSFDHEADRSLPADSLRRSILQPSNNLRCGVKILKNQIIDQQKPLVSPTSYWAPLRPGAPGYETFLHQMVNPPKECGLTNSDRSPHLREIAQ